jgi:hypothetical protein
MSRRYLRWLNMSKEQQLAITAAEGGHVGEGALGLMDDIKHAGNLIQEDYKDTIENMDTKSNNRYQESEEQHQEELAHMDAVVP